MAKRWSGLAAVALLILVSDPLGRADEPAPAAQAASRFDRLPADMRQQVKDKLEAIGREVQRRRDANVEAAADGLAKDLERVQDLLAGKAQKAADAGPELHVIGFYEPVDWRTKVVVEVAATERPVILALCGYEPVRWHVKLADGANVERVLLGGYHEQKLTWADPAVGEKVKVEQHTYESRSPNRFMAYQKDNADYTRLLAALKGLTNLDVTTFQGGYRAEEGTTYVVGAYSPAWYEGVCEQQIEPLYREATALSRARSLSNNDAPFKAVYFSADPPAPRIAPNGQQLPPLPRELVPGVLADFTPRGPIKETFRQLGDRAPVTDVAVDPQQNVVYGITTNDVYRIDPKTGDATRLKVAGDFPRYSWGCGVAFDTNRKRLVVTTLGGSGNMIAYDPAKDQWSYVADMNNIDLAALTYCAQNDCLYGLAANMDEKGAKPKLYTFAADGKQLAVLEIDEVVVTARSMDLTVQLAMAGRNVAIVTPPLVLNNGRGAPSQSGRCIIADPNTGRVISSQVISPCVAAAADFDPAEVDKLWRLLGSENGDEAEKATLRLIAGGDKAAAALGKRVVPGSQPVDVNQVQKLIDQLSSADVADRERATSDLIQLGEPVAAQLRQAGDAELPVEAKMRLAMVLRDITFKQEGDAIPSARARRESRVIRVLQEIGTTEAVQGLITLSGAGSPGSTTATEARAALRKI